MLFLAWLEVSFFSNLREAESSEVNKLYSFCEVYAPNPLFISAEIISNLAASDCLLWVGSSRSRARKADLHGIVGLKVR